MARLAPRGNDGGAAKAGPPSEGATGLHLARSRALAQPSPHGNRRGDSAALAALPSAPEASARVPAPAAPAPDEDQQRRPGLLLSDEPATLRPAVRPVAHRAHEGLSALMAFVIRLRRVPSGSMVSSALAADAPPAGEGDAPAVGQPRRVPVQRRAAGHAPLARAIGAHDPHLLGATTLGLAPPVALEGNRAAVRRPCRVAVGLHAGPQPTAAAAVGGHDVGVDIGAQAARGRDGDAPAVRRPRGV
jgi:hypothetical protein